MASRVHDDVRSRNQEQPVVWIKRPRTHARHFTQTPKFRPQGVLMCVHVGNAPQVDKERITVLNAHQHPVDGQA